MENNDTKFRKSMLYPADTHASTDDPAVLHDIIESVLRDKHDCSRIIAALCAKYGGPEKTLVLTPADVLRDFVLHREDFNGNIVLRIMGG